MRTKNQRFFTLATLIAAGAASSAQAATTILIDDFSVPAGGQTITKNGIGSEESLYTLGGPGLLGGSRLMNLTLTKDLGSIANASANGSVVDKLVYENGSGVESVLQLSYNANGAGLAQNWTSHTEMSFLVDNADQNGTLIIELFEGTDYSGAAYATQTTAIPQNVVLNTLFTVPFASFTAFGGFDFSDVDSIRISIEGPEAYDMVLNSLMTTRDGIIVIPESSAMVPVGGLFAVVGGWWIARRRGGRGAASVA